MNTRNAFYGTEELEERIKEQERQLQKLYKQLQEVKEKCPHEIVFKYMDNHPRKMYIDGHYYCPACEKTIKCNKEEDRLSTPFKASRVISLTNLSLEGSKEVYSIIRNEVYEHMDIYYNPNMCDELLSLRMESLLEEEQVDYNDPKKILEKIEGRR